MAVLSFASKTIKNISNTIQNRSTARKNLTSDILGIKNRRIERERRKEKEDEISAVSRVSFPKGAASLSLSQSGGSFISRILGFIGFVSAGWILSNARTWIAGGKELIGRIQSLESTFTGFVFNIATLMSDIGRVANAFYQNMLVFDFKDTDYRIGKSMQDLNTTLDSMNQQIFSAFNTITEPFMNVPPLGSKGEEDAYTRREPSQPSQQPTPSSGGFSSGNGMQTGKELSQKLISQGFTKESAAALAGSAHYESAGFTADEEFEPNAYGTRGRGWLQWTFGRRTNFENFCKKNNLDPRSKEANYRFLLYELAGSAGNHWTGGRNLQEFKKIKDVNQAEEYFRLGYLRPDPSKSNAPERQRRSNEILKKLGNISGSQTTAAAQPSSSQPSSSQPTSTKPKLNLNKLGFSVGEKAGYSQRRGRIHAGRDIAIESGTPLSVITDATITDVGNDPGGYGYFVAYVDSKGIEHFYGHLREMSKVGKGQKFSAGSIIGYVGSTGRSTGPHLHWEVSPRIGEVGRPRSKIIDPIEYGYSSSAPFGGKMTAPSSTLTPSAPSVTTSAPGNQAQVETEQKSFLDEFLSIMSSQKKGQEIIVINDIAPTSPSQTTMMSGGPSGSTINESELLNSFIKNKLLLDLNYL